MKLMELTAFFAAALLAFNACGADTPETPQPEPPVTSDLELKSLSLREYPGLDIRIDHTDYTVDISFPYGAILGNAHVEYTVAEGITGSPESGSSIDLTKENIGIYLSDAEGHARKYTLNVSVLPSSDIVLNDFINSEYAVEGKISGGDIVFEFPYGADITALTFTVDTYDGTSFEPLLSEPFDLTSPKTLTVTAPDGVTQKTFTLTATVAEQETAVRGVYLPSPSHTSSFITSDNVQNSIELMADLNFNCLFVCAWANSKVAWDSDVLLQNSSYTDYDSANMYARYTGGSGDALKDIIETAHQHGIKVILWFEYGFMHGIGGVNLSDPILSEHPDWIGIGNDGGYSSYNGSDYYLNAYNPEVQDFILSLMKEAVTKYPDVDGVQGDDRLPAMPRNSGYDDVTEAMYRSETGGTPPTDYNNSSWVEWRLGKLNSFAVRMYDEMKALKSDLIVCSAPNKYPWCETNLMQDWPQWIADGAVDLLTVQFYVLNSYETDIRNALGYVSANTSRNLLNPAMILNNGGKIMDRDVLESQLRFNRSVGTCGESQFWFDGLKTDYVQEVFRKFYAAPAKFPDWF